MFSPILVRDGQGAIFFVLLHVFVLGFYVEETLVNTGRTCKLHTMGQTVDSLGQAEHGAIQTYYCSSTVHSNDDSTTLVYISAYDLPVLL